MRAAQVFASLSVLIVGCGEPTGVTDSDLKIRSGIHLDSADRNGGEGLVSIGGCSATLVSRNTLITAAHCTRQGARICVQSGHAKGACTNDVRIKPGYDNRGRINYGYDLAVAVFPGTPFEIYYKLASQPARVGEKVALVGYSSHYNSDPNKGSKRWGLNTIASLDTREVSSISSNYGRSADSVAVDPGDSGGTMLNGRCALIGVTSRKDTLGRFSLHTNVTANENMAWLRTQVTSGKAQICGLAETSSEACLPAGLASPIPNPPAEADGTPGFVCGPPSVGGTPIEDGGPNSPSQVPIALVSGGQGNNLFVAAAAGASSVSVCPDVTAPEQCSPGQPGVTHVGGTQVMLRGSKPIFRVDKTWQVTDLASPWGIVIRDSSGRVLASRLIRLLQ